MMNLVLSKKLYLLSADYIEWFEEWYEIILAPETYLKVGLIGCL